MILFESNYFALKKIFFCYCFFVKSLELIFYYEMDIIPSSHLDALPFIGPEKQDIFNLEKQTSRFDSSIKEYARKFDHSL